MAINRDDIYRAARLIQWGLQPKLRPVQHGEYIELVREYMNRNEFREITSDIADGIGVEVLDVSEHGIILAPREESVFLLKSSDFRPGSSKAEDRLLDGLVQVTIAATIFPRARDLEDDPERPRPPVTIDEIEEELRSLCKQLAEANKNEDPLSDDEMTGLYDAWRVYDNRYSTKETKDDRQSRSSTRRIIEYNLNKLKDYGCFIETKLASKPAWQPTRRYNFLVKEIAANTLFEKVNLILHKEQSEANSNTELFKNDWNFSNEDDQPAKASDAEEPTDNTSSQE